jgi:hypothetical protein
MHRSKRAARAALLAGACLLAVPATGHAAEAFYGVTDENRLVTFTSDAPGDVGGGAQISGLQAGEQVVGLDVRPETDQLYALGSTGRIYLVDPLTGETRVARQTAVALEGAAFGLDFNPVPDALRITSDAEQNLRQPFANESPTVQDGRLAYAAGDPGAGSNPAVAGSAYTNSLPDATTTTLFGIDTARDTLVRQDPPNAGTLVTVGALGIDVNEVLGFDIAVNQVAYASVVRAGSARSDLVRIDLATGRATDTAAGASIDALSSGNQIRPIRALAAAGQVPDDRSTPTVSVAFSSTILEENTDTLEPSISCDESCDLQVSATLAGRRAGAAVAELAGGAGRITVEVPLNQAARQRIARAGTELITLTVVGTDAAGNRVRQERVTRTQTLAGRRSG